MTIAAIDKNLGIKIYQFTLQDITCTHSDQKLLSIVMSMSVYLHEKKRQIQFPCIWKYRIQITIDSLSFLDGWIIRC